MVVVVILLVVVVDQYCMRRSARLGVRKKSKHRQTRESEKDRKDGEKNCETETDEEKENKLTEMCVPNQWMY